MRRPLSALLIFGLAVASMTLLPGSQPQSAASAADAPIRAAFYYPWFGETWYANDRYTPSLGKYSSDDPATLN